jgi:amino acid adenylation domain-containing protein
MDSVVEPVDERVGAVAVADVYVLPASFAQERLWFLDRLDPGSAVYNEPGAFRITGQLDRGALEASLNEIVRRHESLRTNFATEDGVLVQHVHPKLPLALPVVDVSAAADPEAELQRLLAEEVRRPFDLSHAPLFRVRLFAVGAADHVLVVTFHHTVFDGWSRSVFLTELDALYGALRQNKPSPLEELPVQYADFAVWQREQLAGDEVETHRTYWRKQLAGLATVDLPVDRPRPKQQTHRGMRRSFTISPTLAAALKAIGLREKATLFMVTAAAFQTLLYRYSGQSDVAVGITTANRGRSELDGLIGFLANTLVLRVDLAGDPSFAQLLTRVKDAVRGAFAHEDLPFEKMVEAAQVERDQSRSPVFQVLFNHVPDTQVPRLGDLTVRNLRVDVGTAKFDLSVYLGEANGQLEGFVEYNTDLFDSATIERLIGHYDTMLQGIVANPAARLSTLPLLTSAETQQMLYTWNATRSEYPRHQTVAQLFEAQAARRSDAEAVSHEGKSLTYGALNRQAEALAVKLRALGVKPGVLVGICVERSLAMMVGLLATMKAGGAYVPLDPGFPADRLQFMLEDSKASALLTQSKLQGLLVTSGVQVVLLDNLEQVPPSGAKLAPSAGPSDLAYVLYTSGSTGKPKGVEVSHGALTNFLCTLRNEPGCTENDVLLAVTTLSFDIAGLELYLPLICGARIELVSRSVAADGRLLRDKLESLRPTMLQVTPASWRMLIEAGWNGTAGLTALCGGEALPPDLAQLLLERVSALWNMYGPTETTIWSSTQRITTAREEITIGRPIANTTFYVLDQALQPVPVGVPGELYIGGDGVANGYRGRPELTAEKFIPHPFVEEPGARVYRTGDLVRYRADGQVVHLGRLDHQVKIRGFRIELGEIEAALGAAPGVAQCVVVARPDHTGAVALVAYIAPAADARMQASDLRSHLRQTLPDYMVPQHFVEMNALPLTPNGKVDRKQLPAPERDETSAAAHETVAPRTPTESQVAAIFADVLQVPAVSAYTDFFNAGGQSLTAIRLMSKLEAAFRIELPLQTLFDSPTVAALSDRICDITGTARAVSAVEDDAQPRRSPRSTTERQLVSVWQRVLGVQEVGVNESFTKLQGARNLVEEMLAEARRTVGFRAEGIPLSTFLAKPTIEALARLIDGVSEPSPSLVSCLQPVGSKRPLFLIHAGGGYVFFYRALAARLGAGRPIFGVRAVTRADKVGPALEHSESVEQLATRYIAEIRAIQPKGPYTLGGACFGGVVAFEMAHQLRAQGEQIAGPLLLFDAFIRNGGGGDSLDYKGSGYAVNRAMRHLQNTAEMGTLQKVGYLARKVIRNIPTAFSLVPGLARSVVHKVAMSDRGIGLMRFVATKLKSAPMLEKVQQRVGERILKASVAMLIKYSPRAFTGRLVLLKAEQGSDAEPGWRRLGTEGLEIHTMPGAHLDMMEEPVVAKTAAIVSRSLAELAD